MRLFERVPFARIGGQKLFAADLAIEWEALAQANASFLYICRVKGAAPETHRVAVCKEDRAYWEAFEEEYGSDLSDEKPPFSG